jgi:hypothetical protein
MLGEADEGAGRLPVGAAGSDLDSGVPSNLCAWCPRLLAVLLLLSCARSKEKPRAATVASPDASAPVCRALAAPGAPDVRFASALPMQFGGVLFVFGGTSPGAVLRALEPFGFNVVKVVGCDPGKVVVFVEGAAAHDLERLERRIVTHTGARTEESVVVAPHRAAPAPPAAVCQALAAPGSPAERFANVFPLRVGGVILVFEGVSQAAVAAAFDALGLQGTEVVGCDESDVVTFVPGVNSSQAERVEAYVLANVRGAKTKERALFHPQPPVSTRR